MTSELAVNIIAGVQEEAFDPIHSTRKGFESSLRELMMQLISILNLLSNPVLTIINTFSLLQ